MNAVNINEMDVEEDTTSTSFNWSTFSFIESANEKTENGPNCLVSSHAFVHSNIS